MIGNSIFESSSVGLKTTFITAFTGDLFIGPQTERPLSLFGEDTDLLELCANRCLPLQDEIRDLFQYALLMRLSGTEGSSSAATNADTATP